MPSLANEVAQGPCRCAVDGHLDVVERSIGATPRIAASLVGGQVLGGVPARHPEIEAAGECDRVVDDDDLLVLRSSERMLGVETKMHPAMRARSEAQAWQQLALEGVQHREVPVENVDVQPAPASGEAIEEGAELIAPRLFRRA
jgi:hypothetical protein